MTYLDLKVLLFFLASYKTLALCGHPVIEKMQKIIMYDTLFAFFDEKKISDFSLTATVRRSSCDLRRVYELRPQI